MTLSELGTAQEGRICYADRWWEVTADDHVLFFRTYTSPQCNRNRAVIDRPSLAQKELGETHPVFVPFAFVPHDCSDYCQ